MSDAIGTKKYVTTLYADRSHVYTDVIRFVLAEKNIAYDFIDVQQNDLPQSLLELNPAANVPTFIDRDLMLNHVDVICEYLEERFPHPPLMPIYPMMRARLRLTLKKIKRDWFSSFSTAASEQDDKAYQIARRHLAESILLTIPIFRNNAYFFGPDFTMLDAYIVPLLWRLSDVQIELPQSAQSIKDYLLKIQQRDSFANLYCGEEIKVIS